MERVLPAAGPEAVRGEDREAAGAAWEAMLQGRGAAVYVRNAGKRLLIREEPRVHRWYVPPAVYV